jgi:hypothetical protein
LYLTKASRRTRSVRQSGSNSAFVQFAATLNHVEGYSCHSPTRLDIGSTSRIFLPSRRQPTPRSVTLPWWTRRPLCCCCPVQNTDGPYDGSTTCSCSCLFFLLWDPIVVVVAAEADGRNRGVLPARPHDEPFAGGVVPAVVVVIPASSSSSFIAVHGGAGGVFYETWRKIWRRRIGRGRQLPHGARRAGEDAERARWRRSAVTGDVNHYSYYSIRQ